MVDCQMEMLKVKLGGQLESYGSIQMREKW